MKFRCEGFMACEPLFHRINEMRRCLFGEFIRSNLAPCTLRIDGTLTIAETVGFGIAAERPILESRDGAASIKPFEFTKSEERRVGKACVSTFRSRWSRYH